MSSMHLPNHVLEEILSRLPVKSLIRFRCVCKSLKDLLSDRLFINMHLNRSIERGAINIFLRLHVPPYTIYSLDPEEPNHVVNLGYSSLFGEGILWESGCDGLVCLRVHYKPHVVLMLNPSTRKYGKMVDNSEYPNLVAFGTFYDRVSCDYKLLHIEHNGGLECEVMIYTFAKNTWKTITHIPYVHFSCGRGELVNGAIHWIVTRFNPDDDFCPDYIVLDGEQFIVTFNPACENFLEVPLPNLESEHRPLSIMHLTELAGCLCICRIIKKEYEIWLMKKYGIKESWTKLLVLPYFHPQYVEPLYITKKGDLLLDIRWKGLFLYDQENKRLNKIEIVEKDTAAGTSNKIEGAFSTIAYVDSLLAFEEDSSNEHITEKKVSST